MRETLGLFATRRSRNFLNFYNLLDRSKETEPMAQRPVYDNGRVLKYLDHIGVPHSIRDRQDLAALRTLQQHHLARVPFENLSLHYSKSHTVSLDPDELYEKVVIRGRGGYCVEVNCLFATILRSLGFTLYSAGARVNVNKSEVQFNFLYVTPRLVRCPEGL